MKRFVDIAVSTLFLLPLLLALPFLYLFHSYLTRSPFIFKQIRVGRNGIPFICLKITSIFHGDNIPEYLTGWADSYSHFIRRYRIDELPQLVNILLGEMSLVGPRPIVPAEMAEHYAIDPRILKRHRVSPGLTGLSQITVSEAMGKDESLIARKINLDIYYSNNSSLLLDIKILLGTVFFILSHRELPLKFFGIVKTDNRITEDERSANIESMEAA